MPDIANPHDRFFRDSFGQRELAADFCQHYIPAEVAATLNPDPDAWQLRTESFVDEALGGHFADLLYATRLLGGTEAYVYLLFEHKSAAEPHIALQLLRYMVRIWEHDRREQPAAPLRPILPVVVYHGRHRWRVAPDFASLIQPPAAWRRYCPDFRYLLSDVSRHSPAPQVGTPRLQARLLVLRAAFGRDLVGDLVAILGQLAHLGEVRLQAREVDIILVYLGATPAGRKPPGVLAAAREAVQMRGDDMVNEWELQKQRWRDEGRAEGQTQGIRQGIALALELKFGAAGRGLMPAIEQMHDAAQLQAVLVAIRDAVTLDDMVRHLGQPAV